MQPTSIFFLSAIFFLLWFIKGKISYPPPPPTHTLNLNVQTYKIITSFEQKGTKSDQNSKILLCSQNQRVLFLFFWGKGGIFPKEKFHIHKLKSHVNQSMNTLDFPCIIE